MAQVRYSVVFGIKDTADRLLPMGEIYLRNTTLEEAKALFKTLPQPSNDGDYVLRIYERYYDKHLEPDINYQKTEYTLECDRNGLDTIIHFLLDK
ncbi:MAG: hypothetical protein ABFS32_14925 [Bacteroidota bacterium]